MNKSFLYLLLCTGLQWSFGFTVPQDSDGLNYPLDPLEKHKNQHDTPKKALEEFQISTSFHKQKDSPNFSLPCEGNISCMSVINDVALLVNAPPVNYAVETPFLIVSNNKLQDEISFTLNNDIQRFKRFLPSSDITTTTSSPIVNAYSYYTNKLVELENNMSNMNKNIKQLKTSRSLSNEDKEQFAAGNLSGVFYDERDTFVNAIDSLSNTMSNLNRELLDLRQKVADQVQSARMQERLMTECIEYIQTHNFTAAREKINLFEDKTKIGLIVHQVYNNQAANFDLILEFGDNVLIITRSFLIYKALNCEMESNGHSDPSKMMRLIESLNNNVINIENTESDTRKNAESLIANLKNTLKTVVKEKLKEGMLNDRYISVADLVKTIYDFSEEMFKELIEEVVKEIHKSISTEKLLSTIPSESRYVEQTAAIYFSLLDVMEENEEFYTQSIFKVAYHIKSSVRSHNPNFLSLKNRLPESVRNAVFASKVCIKNVLRNEYMYAPRAWGKTFDSHRGYVFTWISGSKVTEADWVIKPDGDNFYIKSYVHNEYLFSARPSYKTFSNDLGYVLTWIPGYMDLDELWKIEPAGDNCYINNDLRNEYLYSANQTYDKERRYVFSWIPGDRVAEAEWKIEDCSEGI